MRFAITTLAAAWTASLVSAAGAAEPASINQAAAAPDHELRVVGYLPDYRVKAFPLESGKYLTDLILFSLEPTSTGELNSSRLTREKLARLQEFKQRFKLRTHVSVGGWGRSKGFAAMAQDADRRRKFVGLLLKFCRDNNLDGVDFDWEFPSGRQQRDAYASLLGETKKAFAPHKKTVSVAVAPLQELSSAALGAVDHVHLMSYNHDGRHATFEQAKADVAKFLAKGVPAKRLVLGVPFYARTIAKPSKVLTYAQIVRRHKPAQDVDQVDGYYFNSVATVRKKVEFAQTQKLGGIMIWEVTLDASGDASLLNAVWQVSNAPH